MVIFYFLINFLVYTKLAAQTLRILLNLIYHEQVSGAIKIRKYSSSIS